MTGAVIVGNMPAASANDMTITLRNGAVVGKYIDETDQICVNNGLNASVDAYVYLRRPDGSIRADVTDPTAGDGKRACTVNLSIPEDEYGWRIELHYESDMKLSDRFYT
ncbi:hypothetical protein GCM10009719_10220 [Nocardioides kribbensis]